MDQRYCIFWKYLDDSKSGNGEFSYSLQCATMICIIMNKKYKNEIYHWYASEADYESCNNPSNNNPSINEFNTDPCTLEA